MSLCLIYFGECNARVKLELTDFSNLAKLVIWSTLSLGKLRSKYIFRLSQFSLMTGFFEGMRENILHIFQASKTAGKSR